MQSEMMDLSTNYAGLKLKNPIIAASSGLTRQMNTLKKLEEAGVAAVVLKSIFEEQIEAETEQMIAPHDFPGAEDYIATYVKSNEISTQLDFIRQAKAELSIPVIASINCFRSDSWVSYAKHFEEAGADAIEVNIMRLETDLFYKAKATEGAYVDIVRSLAEEVKIPVMVKISKYMTNVPALADKLRAVGAKGIVLFNRAYQPDIDIERVQMVAGNVFTSGVEIADTIRYAGIVSDLVPGIDIASSTGIHSGADVIKCLLAGADATQLCTLLYQQGPEAVSEVLTFVEDWMKRKGYYSIDEFKGKLNAGGIKSATMYERMQFMKYFSSRS